MANNLSLLLKGATGIADDSREVREGFIFVAIQGETVDGHDYIEKAISKGAKTVVGERDFDPPTGVVYMKVSDSRDALGRLASEFFGNPSQKLKVIGVTGTKGKTTTSHIVYHMLTGLGKKSGLISSIMAKIGDKEVDTGFHVTSPSVIELHRFLKKMVDSGCEYAVVEVSSHGIAQKRIAGANFEVGVLTNIAPEHLDYHKTFSGYKKTKMSFINSAKYKVIAPVDTKINSLPGKFNNLNIEAALDTIQVLGFDKKLALSSLSSFDLPLGRLQEIENDIGIEIYVDFAHTPESLEAVLTYLKTTTNGKLISVFGCAGERDKSKRFKMGAVSAKIADFSIFTAEDPRSEDIFAILSRMSKGARSTGETEDKDYICIPERGEAVAYALSHAGKGDVVAFLGKGHERSMAYKGFEHPWSDQDAINDYLNAHSDKSVIILAAGKGTRMKSKYPKLIHEICGRPLISYTLQNLRQSGIKNLIAVVSFKKNLVIRKIKGDVKIAVQSRVKGGTADAARSGLPQIFPQTKTVIVINGDDSAFYTPKTIRDVIATHLKDKSVLTFVSLEKDNPTGLGRVLRDRNGEVSGIVEEKNASDSEKKIKEVNDGLYVFEREWLLKNIVKVEKNPISREYYIGDLIRLAVDQKQKLIAYKLPNPDEWQGVNSPEELEIAQLKMEKRLKEFNSNV